MTSDGWYESEESTRRGLVTELRRIALRTRARPWRVLALAALLTAGITYKVATKERIYEADVVLALTESSLSSEHTTIPYDQLRQYVETTLLPDRELEKLIETRNLHRLRRTLGMTYAITELREQLEIEIWKNSFVYYHSDESRALKSARIGITVMENDPDLAFDIARDVAAIAIAMHEERRLVTARKVAAELALARDGMSRKLAALAQERAHRQAELAEASQLDQRGRVAVLVDQLATLARAEREAYKQRTQILTSPDANADRIASAGLGTSLEIVEERRPQRPERSWFSIVLAFAVVATGALVGSALVLGAFDSRIHDPDDVTRLGLPMFGSVPAFPGDRIGSLAARGASVQLEPWWQRWRLRS